MENKVGFVAKFMIECKKNGTFHRFNRCIDGFGFRSSRSLHLTMCYVIYLWFQVYRNKPLGCRLTLDFSQLHPFILFPLYKLAKKTQHVTKFMAFYEETFSHHYQQLH